ERAHRGVGGGEAGEGAVAGGVDDAALVPGQDVGERIVMALDEAAPGFVAERGEVGRRADDVGEREGEVPLEAPQKHLGDELWEPDHFREAHGFEFERHGGHVSRWAGRRSLESTVSTGGWGARPGPGGRALAAWPGRSRARRRGRGTRARRRASWRPQVGEGGGDHGVLAG